MRHVRRHLTYSNVMVTILAFVVLGGGTALASFVISSNSQVGPGTISGHKPPSGDHANIIGGSINGNDVADNTLGGADINESSLSGNARKVTWGAAGSTSFTQTTPIATVGPYTLKGTCWILNDFNTSFLAVYVYANGPSGSYQLMYDETYNDNEDVGSHSKGQAFGANTDTRIFTDYYSSPSGFGVQSGDFGRTAGTVMLKSDAGVLVQVDFDEVTDYRSSPGHCAIYGTATRAT